MSSADSNPDEKKNYTPNVGLEPTTLRLRVSCSTDWASRAGGDMCPWLSNRPSITGTEKKMCRTENKWGTRQRCGTRIGTGIGVSTCSELLRLSSRVIRATMLWCIELSLLWSSSTRIVPIENRSSALSLTSLLCAVSLTLRMSHNSISLFFNSKGLTSTLVMTR